MNIICCPSCSTRFRIGFETQPGRKFAVRCRRCRTVIPITPAGSSDVAVLIVTDQQDLGLGVVTLLDRAGISRHLCTDGEKALATAERLNCKVVLLDVGLPSFFAFRVIDQFRSSQACSGVKVILLASVYNRQAFKCTPATLHGADDYIDQDRLQEDLINTLGRHLGLGEKGQRPQDSESLSREGEGPQATRIDNPGEARELALLLVSDMALYHQDLVDEGIRQKRLEDILEQPLSKCRSMLKDRLTPELAASGDFIGKALSELVERRQKEMDS